MVDNNSHNRSPSWSLTAALLVGGLSLGTAISLITASVATAQDRPRSRTNQCTNGACHNTYIDREFSHDAATNVGCLDCHEYADAEQHLFRLTHPRRDLCASCHTLQNQKVVHSPVADNDCQGCHDPHGSDLPSMLVEDPAGGLCVTCHDQDFSRLDYVHGPVAIGACIICHESHSSSIPGLLTKPEDQLCKDCHEELTPKGLAARHQHKPLEEGCTSCHDPHASNHQFQLLKDSPDLCYTCHDGIKHLVEKADNIHGPMTESGGCAQCHNPHFTQMPYLQRESQLELCLECHSEPLQAADGSTLTNMAELLRDNPNHHGPIREGACTTCHQPHASNEFRLLYQQYPAEFYAPFEAKTYELCFSCHLSDMVMDESGTGLTGFRQGDQNLHWLHVNKKKGRTCRACHEVHASKNPFHIRDAVPFGKGGWMLKINFEISEDGGSCAPGCHKPMSYDRTATSGPEPPSSSTLENGGTPP